jgi:hypothetical protein
VALRRTCRCTEFHRVKNANLRHQSANVLSSCTVKSQALGCPCRTVNCTCTPSAKLRVAHASRSQPRDATISPRQYGNFSYISVMRVSVTSKCRRGADKHFPTYQKKMTVAHMVNIFPVFYKSRMFITVFTTARHPIQNTTSQYRILSSLITASNFSAFIPA